MSNVQSQFEPSDDHVVLVDASAYYGPDRPLPSPRAIVGEQERQAALRDLARKEEEHRAAMQQEAAMNEALRFEAEGGREAEWRTLTEEAGFGATR
jgi:hypothetical protein